MIWIVLGLGYTAGWLSLGVLLVQRWVARCKATAHRPHCDEDWHELAWAYRASDPGAQGLLSRLLWRFAAWAPHGAKMIWREGLPYMARIYLCPWWFPRQVYLHRILISDDTLHDHPYEWSLSFLLSGSYREARARPVTIWPGSPEERVVLAQTDRRKRWLNYIPSGAFHALELDRGPVWTLFVCGSRKHPDGSPREWGFLGADGKFTPAGDVQRIAIRRAEHERRGRPTGESE